MCGCAASSEWYIWQQFSGMWFWFYWSVVTLSSLAQKISFLLWLLRIIILLKSRGMSCMTNRLDHSLFLEQTCSYSCIGELRTIKSIQHKLKSHEWTVVCMPFVLISSTLLLRRHGWQQYIGKLINSVIVGGLSETCHPFWERVEDTKQTKE